MNPLALTAVACAVWGSVFMEQVKADDDSSNDNPYGDGQQDVIGDYSKELAQQGLYKHNNWLVPTRVVSAECKWTAGPNGDNNELKIDDVGVSSWPCVFLTICMLWISLCCCCVCVIFIKPFKKMGQGDDHTD